MPLLDNPKHEIFAQELAKGTTADEAYARAGYAPAQRYRMKPLTRGACWKPVSLE